MIKLRKKTTATLLAAIFMISVMALIIPAMAKSEPFTINYYQTQFQWRGNKNAFGSWTYANMEGWTDSEYTPTGNVLHTYIEYSPLVEDLTGESNVYVKNKKSGDWILREGKITYKYEPGYGPYTVVNFFRGYMDFDGIPSEQTFTKGVFYQWVYLFAPESEEVQIREHIDYAVWDPVMEGWLIGFSIYYQDPQIPSAQHSIAFPGPLADFPRPVPAKIYNHLDL